MMRDSLGKALSNRKSYGLADSRRLDRLCADYEKKTSCFERLFHRSKEDLENSRRINRTLEEKVSSLQEALDQTRKGRDAEASGLRSQVEAAITSGIDHLESAKDTLHELQTSRYKLFVATKQLRAMQCDWTVSLDALKQPRDQILKTPVEHEEVQ
ncbi:hypothetical protein BDZ45DRAFT_155122 [Acephala macrosclerotiorum]|nr:hypothetical protein BDZ45DRAFT_155122 [Acephala macrosclerotiorum]